jgi:hypothetical protein
MWRARIAIRCGSAELDCGMRSFHPDDIKWGYCGSCHAFTQEGTVHKVNTPREKEN